MEEETRGGSDTSVGVSRRRKWHEEVSKKRVGNDSPTIHQNVTKWCIVCSMRTNIDIDENLVRKARKLTRLESKRQIVHRALELLVRSESRKGILRYYGSGIWKGDAKALRRNRV